MILEDSHQISECAHEMGQSHTLPLFAEPGLNWEIGAACLGKKVGLCLGQNQAKIGPM